MSISTVNKTHSFSCVLWDKSSVKTEIFFFFFSFELDSMTDLYVSAVTFPTGKCGFKLFLISTGNNCMLIYSYFLTTRGRERK